MKKKGGGKAKGSAFERWVAKRLSHWLTLGADDKQLIRSVLSGGWTAGQRGPAPHFGKAPEGWRQVGDLAPNGTVGEAFRKVWAVECKHRRGIDFWHVFTAKPSENNILGWWDKLRIDAEEAGVRPMLVFRSNGKPTMVGIPASLGYSVGHEQSLLLPDVDLQIFPFDLLLDKKPGLMWFRK